MHHLKLVEMPICIKPGYVASGWAWHSRQVTCKSMEWSPRRVSFDPSNVLPWAWQEVKGEAMPLSVNEADYSYGINGETGSYSVTVKVVGEFNSSKL